MQISTILDYNKLLPSTYIEFFISLSLPITLTGSVSPVAFLPLSLRPYRVAARRTEPRLCLVS